MLALKKLEKICAQNPTSILFARLADGLLQQGDVTRAIEICRRGLRYRPSYVAGHVVMGKCCMAAGHCEAARLAFQKVLQLDADHLAARWHLGKIDLQLGRDDLARKHFELAQALDPFCPELREQIRKLKGDRVEDERGDTSEPEALSADSDDREAASEAEVFSQISDLSHLAEKDIEENLDALVMSRKQGPKSAEEAPAIATTTLAELYAKQGLIREAIAVLEQIVAREPNNEHVIARLDELHNLPE